MVRLIVSSDRPNSGERTRILVLPDGLLGPELGESFLDRRSLSLRSAGDVAEALAIAELWRPNLVVFSAELRAEVGSFFAGLRGNGRREPPKLLMVTDRLHEHQALVADAACDAHLVSPLDVDQLLSTIAELLGIERRSCERVPIDVLVHTEGFVGEGAAVDSGLASTLSLCEESILVEASRQLVLHARGRLQFFLPGSAERLSLEGIVRVSVDEVRLIYVIELVDLAPQHRALIRRYVESQREAA